VEHGGAGARPARSGSFTRPRRSLLPHVPSPYPTRLPRSRTVGVTPSAPRADCRDARPRGSVPGKPGSRLEPHPRALPAGHCRHEEGAVAATAAGSEPSLVEPSRAPRSSACAASPPPQAALRPIAGLSAHLAGARLHRRMQGTAASTTFNQTPQTALTTMRYALHIALLSLLSTPILAQVTEA